MNISIKALLSPRFLQRNQEEHSGIRGVVKFGDITIVRQDSIESLNGQKVHMMLVKEEGTLTAKFYADSKMSFCFGSLAVEKCKISLSSSDLTQIEVTKRDNPLPCPGMLIKVKSEEDAKQWVEAMSK